MKKFFIGFCVSFIILLIATLWLVLQKNEPVSFDFFLQQRWPEISRAVNATDTLDLSHLLSDSRPAELTSVDHLLAHYQNYNLKELQALFHLSRSCSHNNIAPESVDLKKAWQWVSFTCAQIKLPSDFFKKPPYTFPSGQSFVQLAEDLKFDFSGYLTSEEIKTFKSISELMAATSVGADLNLQQINGFINGEEILIGDHFIYLKVGLISESSRGRIYRRFPKQQWQESMTTENFLFTDQISERCLQIVTNGCWTTNRLAQQVQRRYYLYLVLVLDVGILLTGLFFFIVDRRRRRLQKENQRFTLQMLTHELRTPVTTLSLQVENIRRGFDRLNDQQQIDFLKMSQELARLRNSMQMSYAYLQTDAVSENKIKIRFEKIELVQFLKDLVDECKIEMKNETLLASFPKDPVWISAEPNWLKLCLNNLIKNAFDHGKPPVWISIIFTQNEIGIQVSDQGLIQEQNLDLLTKPFQKGQKSQGLGLGLSIICQILKEMHGRLIVEREPTRFTLFFRRTR